jgi:hypothetical protein
MAMVLILGSSEMGHTARTGTPSISITVFMPTDVKTSHEPYDAQLDIY